MGAGRLRQGMKVAAVAASWSSAQDLFGVLTLQQEFKSIGFWDFLRQYRKDEAELQHLRDAALATRGSDTPGYVPPEVDCPGRHWVKPFITWDDGFDCSICGQGIDKAATCVGCRLCDYDVCPDCLQKILHRDGNALVSDNVPPGCSSNVRAGMQKKLHRRLLRSVGVAAVPEAERGKEPSEESLEVAAGLPKPKGKTRSGKTRPKTAEKGATSDVASPPLPGLADAGSPVGASPLPCQDFREAWEVPVPDSDDPDL